VQISLNGYSDLSVSTVNTVCVDQVTLFTWRSSNIKG